MEKLKSRKLWAAVVGAALASLADQLGITATNVNDIVQLIMAYIVTQGVHDVVKTRSGE